MDYLLIDKVKPGFGTSNDASTSRRFFAEYQTTAVITGVDPNLLYRLGTFLRALASGHEINVTKFRDYCVETRKLYISLFPLYYMPATLHKILVHGAEIVVQ